MDDSLTEAIRSYAEVHAAGQLQFTIDLCEENTFTFNPAGTNRVAEMLLDRIDGLFPHHSVVEQEEVGNHHILRTRPCSEGIYILGHMDTVFPPDHPFQKCRTEGEWLFGPGSGDMKGGLAVVVYALGALAETGVLPGLDIALILSADEEIGAVSSREIYEREAGNAEACLAAECAGPSGEVVTSRNGKAGLKVWCSGTGQHVSSVSAGKQSAILEIAHKVIALEALNASLPGLALNVGRIEGGLGPCTVPAEASCLVDMRYVEETSYDTALERISGILSEPIGQGCECGFEVLNRRPAMPATDQTRALYGTLESLARSAGITVGNEHRQGTSDANFFGSAGVPTIDGLGPVCLDDHTSNERIHIPSLPTRTFLLAGLIAEIGQPRASDPGRGKR